MGKWYTVATASVEPTAIGAVSSRYVPVALHWNVGPQALPALYMKLCIRSSRRYSLARWPDLSFSSWANIVMMTSLSHVYDLPTGVGNSSVPGGVDSFTSSPGRSMCSNSLLEDEYARSTLFTYQRSPPGVFEK
uniref:Uncharacterized protein n=1 Tax=Anopheles melas TaxID=34690 RepID=A0A182TVQ3_9DIPT